MPGPVDRKRVAACTAGLIEEIKGVESKGKTIKKQEFPAILCEFEGFFGEESKRGISRTDSRDLRGGGRGEEELSYSVDENEVQR